jgi:hypothetical protein
VKSSAVLFLVVALLLPFRGALAAAGLLCHAGNFAPVVAVQPSNAEGHDEPNVVSHDDGHGPAMHFASGGHAPHGESAAPADDAGAAGGATTCDLCASVCASPPIPGHDGQLVPLVQAANERFPAVDPPRPAPVLGGLERPPRIA